MKTTKKYVSPSVQFFNLEVEQIIATSPSIGTGSGDVDAGGALSNKRQVNNASNIWNSTENDVK